MAADGLELSCLLADCGAVEWGVCRFDPSLISANARPYAIRRLPTKAASVISFLFPYSVGTVPNRNLSLYAMIPDYHTIVGAILDRAARRLTDAFAGFAFAAFVDVSPLREVEAAVRAGLGLRGQNGLLIAPTYGSLVFLGELVTDLPLPAATPLGDCDGCGRCLRACPTAALTAHGPNPLRCRSALTQKKGTLTESEQQSLRDGALAWGCDICLLACPHNRTVPLTPIDAFRSDVVPLLTPQNLDILLENRAFAWRGRAVLERNLALL